MKCPMCDTKSMKSKVENRKAKIPSGDVFSYQEKVFFCKSCGFEGPLSKSAGVSYEKNKKVAVSKAIKSLVSSLHSKFVNLLYIERALDLPRRTLSRWKTSGESSTSSLLLLKMVQTFPFLLAVAENKFDTKFAEKALLDAASKVSEASSQTASAFYFISSAYPEVQNINPIIGSNISPALGVTITKEEYSRAN